MNEAVTERGMGYVPDLPDVRDWLFAAKAGPPPMLPAKVDPRPNLYPAVPYDQSSANSCTANAVAAMYGDVDRKQGGSNIDPSRLQIYYDARKLDGIHTVDRGSAIRSALKSVATLGVAPESSWAYDLAKVNAEPPPNVYSEAERKQVIGYFRVDIRIDTMKQCLAEDYSFVMGNTLYENYYQIGSNGLVPMPKGKVIGGHAQKYVGYDDAARVFIVQGSWALFGDRGFVYFPYDYAGTDNLSADGWTIRALEETAEPRPEPEPIPAPDARPEIVDAWQKHNKLKAVVQCKNTHPDATLWFNGVKSTAGLTGDRFVVKLDAGRYQFKVVNPNGQESAPVLLNIVQPE